MKTLPKLFEWIDLENIVLSIGYSKQNDPARIGVDGLLFPASLQQTLEFY